MLVIFISSPNETQMEQIIADGCVERLRQRGRSAQRRSIASRVDIRRQPLVQRMLPGSDRPGSLCNLPSLHRSACLRGSRAGQGRSQSGNPVLASCFGNPRDWNGETQALIVPKLAPHRLVAAAQARFGLADFPSARGGPVARGWARSPTAALERAAVARRAAIE